MRTELKTKNRQAAQRAGRVRAATRGTTERPRLSVFRSNRYYSAQIIDDSIGKTLASSSTKTTKDVESLGVEVAKAAKAAGVNKVVFDRGALSYGGNLAKLADAARKQGLDF